MSLSEPICTPVWCSHRCEPNEAAACINLSSWSGYALTVRDRSETENLRPVLSRVGEFSDLFLPRSEASLWSPAFYNAPPTRSGSNTFPACLIGLVLYAGTHRALCHPVRPPLRPGPQLMWGTRTKNDFFTAVMLISVHRARESVTRLLCSESTVGHHAND